MLSILIKKTERSDPISFHFSLLTFQYSIWLWLCQVRLKAEDILQWCVLTFYLQPFTFDLPSIYRSKEKIHGDGAAAEPD